VAFLVKTYYSNCKTPWNGVIDIDNNRYNSVIIGTQEWIKENLYISKYSDVTIIPQVTDLNLAWEILLLLLVFISGFLW
jgi:hypothetical protein